MVVHFIIFVFQNENTCVESSNNDNVDDKNIPSLLISSCEPRKIAMTANELSARGNIEAKSLDFAWVQI